MLASVELVEAVVYTTTNTSRFASERPAGRASHGRPGRDLDEMDLAAVADVQGHGWQVLKMLADEQTAGWAFTVGPWRTYGHPELAMFGLRLDDMQNLAEQGRRYGQGRRQPVY